MIYKASHVGAYHKSENKGNQDHIYTIQEELKTVISLADGVSTCDRAKSGAEIASEAVSKLLVKRGEKLIDFSNVEIADIAVNHVLRELERKAKHENRPVADYSSTLASVLYEKKHGRLLCINVGDSMIIAFSGGEYEMIAVPFDSSEGCCVTTTKNSALAATAKVISGRNIDSIMICSDGAWRHMFARNRLKTEVANMLKSGNFEDLRDYLDEQECTDDYSFVAMEIDKRRFA